MKTTFPVDAPPAVWAALADPEALAAALPGCRSVTPAGDGDGTLQVVADLTVASVRGLWAGTVTRIDGDAVRVAGSGAPGTVDLVVRADAARSALTVEGTVDGPLATVGSAVLAASVRRMGEAMLAAAATPSPGRAAEPVYPSGSAGGPRRGRRVLSGTAAAAGVIVVVVVGRRRRTRRRVR